VYSLKGAVQPGNSGGPLVDKDGEVIGMIFAESTVYDTVGYALQMDSVIHKFNAAKDRIAAVDTGSCRQ
jgi:S1-C subfamily serine protease